MNAAAKAVMTDVSDITLAYGVSDEYRFVTPVFLLFKGDSDLTCTSFIFHKSTTLFERRARFVYPLHRSVVATVWSCSSPEADVRVSISKSKLVSTVVSTFTANYIYSWSTYFPDTPLSQPLPSFDGRAVCYPSLQNLRDYLSWRQVDCMDFLV